MSDANRPLRLFLDSGVILSGCFSEWGASKALLILTTMRSAYTVVLAEAVELEVRRSIMRKMARMDLQTAAAVPQSIAAWLDRVRVERHPLPPQDEVRALAPTILPALRHVNDLPVVVTAMRAKPDWVLSTNTAHWNGRLAQRTGLRIATPLAFLRQLHPNERG